jgi:hypothetical protein
VGSRGTLASVYGPPVSQEIGIQLPLTIGGHTAAGN